jgi:exosortase
MPEDARNTPDPVAAAPNWPIPLALAAALAWSYAPNLVELADRWRLDPDYNHGFFVIPLALAIAWRRRAEIARAIAPWPPGWAVLVAVLAARAGFFALGERWSESATLPAAVLAVALAILGPRATWRSLPAIAFLALMLPMPPALNPWTAGPLQSLATAGALATLQATGLPAISEGNVILVGSTSLEVARACSGLAMLLSFFTLIAAEAFLARDRTSWERAALIASAAPIALACNILRIAATAWAYRLLGTEAGEAIAHDAAGWAMMPLALFLGWLEIRILARLFVEDEPADVPLVVTAPAVGRPLLQLEPPPRVKLAPEIAPAQGDGPRRPMIEGMVPSE